MLKEDHERLKITDRQDSNSICWAESMDDMVITCLPVAVYSNNAAERYQC